MELADPSKTPRLPTRQEAAALNSQRRSRILVMNEVVQSLQTASEADAKLSIGWLLVAESAINILNPFNHAAEVAKGFEQKQ